MIHVSIYGRLAKDPKTLTTSTGKDMTCATLAVDATPNHTKDQETVWISVLGFGRQAEMLARHTKGEMVAVTGRLTQSRWMAQDGEERTTFTVIADTIVSARTVRPGGKRKTRPAPEFEDDSLPF